MLKGNEPHKCYVCGKPMSLADWYDTPCCIEHITDRLKETPNIEEEVYEAFLHGTVENPMRPDPSFDPAALEQLMEAVKNYRKQEYVYMATSEEMSEELKRIFPFADVRLVPKAFVAAEDSFNGEQIYVIPAESRPIKIVFEP